MIACVECTTYQKGGVILSILLFAALCLLMVDNSYYLMSYTCIISNIVLNHNTKLALQVFGLLNIYMYK